MDPAVGAFDFDEWLDGTKNIWVADILRHFGKEEQSRLTLWWAKPLFAEEEIPALLQVSVSPFQRITLVLLLGRLILESEDRRSNSQGNP